MVNKTGRTAGGVYLSAKGKKVDMDSLRQRNELMPAVGNIPVNARGDLLGKGGKIIKTREAIMKEYYEKSKGMPDEQIAYPEATKVEDPINLPQKKNKKKSEITTEKWVEDADGNFIPKED
jgi:hypothetical protein